MKKRLRYYFNRMTGFRYTSQEKKITWEIRKKNWKKAAFLLGLMDDKESYRYYERVVRSAKAEEEYKSVYLSADETLKRIGALFSGSSIKRSVALTGGIASIGLFRHELRLADGKDLNIFEKVYLESLGLKIVQSQDRLFHHIDCKELSAPQFYGYISSGPFVSSFQAFIPSNKGKNRFRRVFGNRNKFRHESLVYHLWGIAPPKILETELAELKIEKYQYIERLLSSGCFLDQSDLSSVVVRSLAFAAASLPRCVMHGDLKNPANIINGKDRSAYILDWDSWLIVPVGWGLPVSPHDFRNSRVESGIREFCESGGNLNPHQIRLMVALYNLVRSIRKKNTKVCRAWKTILEGMTENQKEVRMR